MDLQISVFLLFIFFTGGHSLKCYECESMTGSCAAQTVKECPEENICSSSITINGNSKHKVKGCVPSNTCIVAYSIAGNKSYSCCSTDLCNARDALDPSEVFGPSVFPNFPNVPDYPSDANGKKCYNCVRQNCSNIINCPGNADHCLTASGAYGGSSFKLKGCLSRASCDSLTSNPYIQSASCCAEDLCNSAKSVNQSFLFLCCSLLSFILLH
ncbi:uncharacterized protein [Garra rufa]|uniref:uncharacterized protein n=1 Tax=Garra rufa TaxID=137080 RepID=UPI003CCEEC72